MKRDTTRLAFIWSASFLALSIVANVALLSALWHSVREMEADRTSARNAVAALQATLNAAMTANATLRSERDTAVADAASLRQRADLHDQEWVKGEQQRLDNVHPGK